MPASLLHRPVLSWYATHRRDLPWRSDQATPWSVLVSEVMLQQTPVARVLPVYGRWIRRWPRPADLAGVAPGEAVRQWGRLGYPRRALRLHGAAVAITERHEGRVPADPEPLVALPGVGAYTAAAVSSFAFGRRHVVLDTNVRRVLARAVGGHELPTPSISTAERDAAESVLPDHPRVAANWSVAVMELGALVCTARTPRCVDCPIAGLCVWTANGQPRSVAAVRRRQTYAGTDRHCRGRLLSVLTASRDPVPGSALESVWDSPAQRQRCLDGLVADGLVEPITGNLYQLPTRSGRPRR